MMMKMKMMKIKMMKMKMMKMMECLECVTRTADWSWRISGWLKAVWTRPGGPWDAAWSS